MHINVGRYTCDTTTIIKNCIYKHLNLYELKKQLTTKPTFTLRIKLIITIHMFSNQL